MIDILIFRLDQFSFWIGFVAGILFAWLIIQARKVMPTVIKALQANIRSLRESLTTGTENRMRQDVLNWAQKQHLASPLFSLNEIVIKPRILAHNTFTDDDFPEEQIPDITTQTIPYMPDWPEFASTYGARTMDLPTALQGGANLLLMGRPGSGKTVALAYLASQIAHRDKEVGELGNFFPLLLPVMGILSHLGDKDPLTTLVQAITSCYASPVTLPRLRNVLRMLLENGRVILILDGFDELAPTKTGEMTKLLAEITRAYPRIRMVIAAPTFGYGKLSQLGLVPVALAGWNENDKKEFVERWQLLWNNYIVPDELSNSEFIDPLLLKKWLTRRDITNSPFEITLRTWSAFAGDTLGPGAPNAIEAYIRRMTVNFSNARMALEAIALNMVNNLTPFMQQREAETVISKYARLQTTAVTPVNSDDEINLPQNEPYPQVKTSTSKVAPASQLVSALLNNGLLVSHGNTEISFSHIYIMGYLAGSAYANSGDPEQLNQQPEWTGQSVTLEYLGRFGDITLLVDDLLEKGRQTPINHESLQTARWLPVAPTNAPWRSAIMRYLVNILQKDYDTLGLAGRAVSALVQSGDTGVFSLLRQLLKSKHPNIRQLAALGLGIQGEAKSVPDLSGLLNDNSPGVIRAACLGLVSIGNREAMDAVSTLLLHGDEESRRIAAEAIVNHPREGKEILKEGLNMDDLLVRRAVIYGILRADDPELLQLLESTAVQDSQWVVRNAAAQAMEEIRRPNPYIPKPGVSLTEQPWLIKYAAKSGIGVGDEEQGLSLVIQALERGEYSEKIKSLEYLRYHAHVDAVPRLYHSYYGSQSDIREACYDVLWHSHAAGVELPPPIQFGLG